MMLAGLFAVIIQGSIIVGGFDKVVQLVSAHERLEFFNFKFDPFTRHTTLNLFFGQGIFWLSSYGCHQTTVQRYCSMSSLRKAFIALLLTGPLVVITMSLAVLSGMTIFANYAGCDPLTLGLIKKPDQIAPHFVIEHLAPISGLLGLFIACLFSGALSTISSGLNSLVAVTYEDFLKGFQYFRDMSEEHKGRVSKVIGIAYGVLVIIMGFVSGNLGGVLSAALVVNGSVSGPLLGVFVLGVLIPFSNKQGAVVGMLVGHVITLWISIGSLILGRKNPTLPFRLDECQDDIWNTVNRTAAFIRQNQTTIPPPDLEWPEKIYTISYTLYPLIGVLVTVIVSCIVSLITGPTKLTKDQEQYIHPWIVSINRKLRTSKNNNSIYSPSNDFEMEHNKRGHTSPKIILNGMQINMQGVPGLLPPGHRVSQYNSNGAYDNHAFHRN